MKETNKTINIMIGIPYSGKTTFVENNKKYGEYIISADILRKNIYGQEFFKDGEMLIWAIRHQIILNTLQQGTSMIIDETNVTKERRSKIIKLARPYGYKINAILIDTSLAICKERFNIEYDLITDETEKLKKLMKLSKMEEMQKILERPSKDEGFHNIFVFEH